MKFPQTFVLGAVQGLTEFLPVSSTAHLNLVRRLLGWESPGMVLETSLHLGTLAATLAWLIDEETREPLLSLPLAAKVGLATLPAGLAGLFLEKWIESRLRGPRLTAGMLMLGAGLLCLAEAQGTQDTGLSELSYGQAWLIGLAQMLALVPGFSRSGATMSAGLLAGLSRRAAVRFSYLLSVPVVAASGLFKLKDLAGAKGADARLGESLLVGGLTAAGLGWLTLAWMLRHVERRSLLPFALQRGLTALALLATGTTEP